MPYNQHHWTSVQLEVVIQHFKHLLPLILIKTNSAWFISVIKYLWGEVWILKYLLYTDESLNDGDVLTRTPLCLPYLEIPVLQCPQPGVWWSLASISERSEVYSGLSEVHTRNPGKTESGFPPVHFLRAQKQNHSYPIVDSGRVVPKGQLVFSKKSF